MKAKLTKGISWQSPELLAAGESKARELGMSFSAYVCHLVRKDLGWRGVFSQESAAHASSRGAVSPAHTSGAKTPGEQLLDRVVDEMNAEPVRPAKSRRKRKDAAA